MIDILPYKEKKVISRLRYLRMATTMLWSLILLFVIAAVLFLPTLQTINSRYTLARIETQQIEQSGAITKSVDVVGLQQRVQTLQSKLAVPLPRTPMDYIDHIRAFETEGIDLTGYDITDATKPIVQVHGIATTRQNLEAFVTELQVDPTIATVDSPVQNFVKSTQSEFVITITFKSS